MFDVGDLTVLTFGNCVLKTGATKWPLKLYVRFYVFDVFSKNKKHDFLRLLSCFLSPRFAPRSVPTPTVQSCRLLSAFGRNRCTCSWCNVALVGCCHVVAGRHEFSNRIKSPRRFDCRTWTVVSCSLSLYLMRFNNCCLTC